MIIKAKSAVNWLSFMPKALQRRLHGRPDLLAILQNSGWLFLDKILRMGFGLVVGAWVARYLGPSQFGELAYVLAYIAFFQAVANVGLEGIVVREIAQNKQHAATLLGTVFALRLMVGITCLLTAIAGMVWVNGIHDPSVLLTALAGATLIFQASDTVDLWFQSQSQSRRTVLAKLTSYLVSNGVKVALILNSAPLLAFAAVLVLDASIAAIGLSISYKRFSCASPWKQSADTAKKLLKECWPFILGGISVMIYMRIDQIMIKEMLGSQQLGIYAAVLPLATCFQFIPIILNASLAPFIARKKIEGEDIYWNALKKIFRYYALLGWLACMVTIVFAQSVVGVLYGPEYQEGATVISIYVFTNLFINMGVAQGLWMLNERRAIVGLANTLVGAIVCVFGNWLLIPEFGIKGVAAVAVIAQLCSTVLTNLIFSKRMFFMQIRSLTFPFPK